MNKEELLQHTIAIVAKIEGPYRWYVLGGVILIITAFVTRAIFKTFKWIIILIIIAAAIISAMWGIYKLSGIDSVSENDIIKIIDPDE